MRDKSEGLKTVCITKKKGTNVLEIQNRNMKKVKIYWSMEDKLLDIFCR